MDSSELAEPNQIPLSLTAPPVEVVVIVEQKTDLFSETLISVGSQDYPDLAVTVLLPDGGKDVEDQVLHTIPEAKVQRVQGNKSYGYVANEVLSSNSPPAFYVFCHSEVALAVDAVRLLVEEAVRSNASVVGPKLVDWDEPDLLLEIGLNVDKLGHVVPRVEIGELDQEQHDAVADVFAISGAVQLVRADLFRALQGFSPGTDSIRSNVDFCWRANISGARVIVAPSAVVRRRTEASDLPSDSSLGFLGERDRVRTLLSVYGIGHSLRVIPQGLLFTLVRALGALIAGRFAIARDVISAWLWNITRPVSLLRRRSLIRSNRKLRDADVRRLQVRGLAPISQFLRGSSSDAGDSWIAVRCRNLLQSFRSGPSRASLSFWAIFIFLFLFGSRHLITRQVPAVGDLVPIDLGPTDLFVRWFDSWWVTGTGHEGAAPTAFGILGVLGVLFFGFMGLLRTVLTIGMIPIGAIGMWRFLHPFSSPWIRVIGTMIYLASPVPYNALINGSWGAVLLYGLMPWVLSALSKAGGLPPFGRKGGDASKIIGQPDWKREVLSIGLLMAALVAFVPFASLLFLGMVILVIFGSVLCGWPEGSVRLGAVAFGGILIAGILNLPWILDALSTTLTWDWFMGTRPVRPETGDLGSLLRFDTGPFGGAPLGWALPLVGLFPVLLARGARWAWAIRGLCFYLASVALVWAAGEGWVPISLPRPEVVFSLGSLGLAISAAMGVAAIERDLRTYKFGWRQLAPVATAVAVVLALVPSMLASLDGGWRMAEDDFNRRFTFEPLSQDPQRTLWIGHDDVLAAGGRSLFGDLTVAITADVSSSIVDRWSGVPEPADPLIAEALELALNGGTSRLGRLLAPFGIGQIVVLERLSPAPSTGLEKAVPDSLLAALTEQFDLAELEMSPGFTRYQNTAALPIVALLPDGTTSKASLRQYAAARDPISAGSMSVTSSDRTSFQGVIGIDQEVYLSVPTDSAWRLSVDGQIASRSPALDWAVAYTPGVAGSGELKHSTAGLHRVVITLQAILWVFAIIAILPATTSAREQSQISGSP